MGAKRGRPPLKRPGAQARPKESAGTAGAKGAGTAKAAAGPMTRGRAAAGAGGVTVTGMMSLPGNPVPPEVPAPPTPPADGGLVQAALRADGQAKGGAQRLVNGADLAPGEDGGDPMIPQRASPQRGSGAKERSREYQQRVDILKDRLAQIRSTPEPKRGQSKSVADELAVRAVEAAVRAHEAETPGRERGRGRHRASRHRRRRSRSRSERSSSRSRSRHDDFAEESKVKEMATKSPGKLLVSMLRRMREFVADRGEKSIEEMSMMKLIRAERVATRYLLNGFLPAQEKALGLRSSRELRTWAE